MILKLLNYLFVPLIVTARHCHNFNDQYINHLATKTPYRFIQNVNSERLCPKCTIDKILMINRHGTRYPSEKLILQMSRNLTGLRNEIINNHASGKGSLCDNVLHSLSKWTTDINTNETKFLTHEGEEEMIALAERYQLRFPEVLSEIYSNSSYQFRTTDTQRTISSLKSFCIGLFGRYTAQDVWFPPPIYKDPILRFYKLCPRWRQEVDKNPDAIIERRKFESSKQFQAMIQRVSERLGFSQNLTLDTIMVLYKTCGFETAWYPQKKCPWCFIFTVEDLELIEYAEDLEYYWVDGYGYPINYQQACPVTQNIIDIFTDQDSPKATIYFTHSGTLLKVLAHLGLYDEGEPLRHDNFKMNRLWRVSKIDAFGSNLVFALTNCNGDNFIRIFHQEREVFLPGLGSSPCSIDSFIKRFGMCNFSKICSIK